MIIAIDGYEANVPSRVGIGRYAFEILKGIYALRLGQASRIKGQGIIRFRIYLPCAPLADMPRQTAWWRYRVAQPRKLWTFLGLPFALLLDRPAASVVFSPTHYIPRFINIPRIMSVMDISYLRFPELFRTKDLHQLIHWTAYSLARAKRIFTISEFSKSDIIEAYDIPRNRVIVTYPGATMNINPRSKTQNPNIIAKYNLSKHYILSVGTLQPRKNYSRLIEAFAKFLKQNKQKFGSVELVIVGKRGWLYEKILSAPKRFGVADKVKFLDFVRDEDLPGLYREALCFALPSLYEGFGLPVLEAMAQGCPVVVSNSSSLPEIAGKAGVYVNPENVDSIAQGLLSAVRQRNLIQGKQRIRLGLEQAKKFSWEKAAKKTLEVLEEVGKGNG